jgi:multiple sugar transport system permease protein
MRSRLAPYLFVSPAMVLLVTFGIVPILVAAVISTTNMNISAFASWDNVDFVGADNYVALFADPDFWQALKNTVYFTIVVVPVQCSLALALAMLVPLDNTPTPDAQTQHNARSLYLETTHNHPSHSAERP